MKPHLSMILVLATAPCVAAQTNPVAVIQTDLQARTITFSPDGKWIATIDPLGRNPAIWEAETGRKVAALPRVRFGYEIPTPSGGSVSTDSNGPREGDTLVFSPDGQHLAAFRADLNDGLPGVVWNLGTWRGNGWWKPDASGEVKLVGTNLKPTDVTAWYLAQNTALSSSIFTKKAVSADGSYAATIEGKYDAASVEVWDVKANRRLGSIPLAGKPPNTSTMSFSPDGGILVLVIGHGAEVWQVNPLAKLKTVAPELWTFGLKFSPDGLYLGLFGGEGLSVFRVGNWEQVLNYASPHGHSPLSFGDIAFSRDSRKLAAAHGDIHVWDLVTGKSQNLFGQKYIGDVSVLAVNPVGSALATGRGTSARHGYQQNSIEVWPLRAKAEPSIFANNLNSLKSLAFSHDSNWLAAASQTQGIAGRYTEILIGSVGLWHFPDGAETKLTLEDKFADRNFDWSATSVAFSSDDKQLAADVYLDGEPPKMDCDPGVRCDPETFPYDVRTIFFDVSAGHAVNSTPLGSTDSSFPPSTWLSPNGRRALARRNLLLYVNTLTGKNVRSFEASKAAAPLESDSFCDFGVPAIGFGAFRPDMKQAVISDGHELEIIDARTGATIGKTSVTVPGDPKIKTLAGAFNSEGDILAVSVCSGWIGAGELRLYNAVDLHPLLSLSTNSVITSLAFAGRKLLFTGEHDGTIRLWETDDGTLLATMIRSSEGEWIVFTPDGLYDGSANGANLLGWRLKGQMVLASELTDTRMAGLLSKLVAGERPKPATPLASTISAALEHGPR